MSEKGDSRIDDMCAGLLKRSDLPGTNGHAVLVDALTNLFI
jgi:hypothetical protein